MRRTSLVVVLDEHGQDGLEVAAVADQQPVQAFGSRLGCLARPRVYMAVDSAHPVVVDELRRSAISASPCTVKERCTLRAWTGSKPITTGISQTPGSRSRMELVPRFARSVATAVSRSLVVIPTGTGLLIGLPPADVAASAAAQACYQRVRLAAPPPPDLRPPPPARTLGVLMSSSVITCWPPAGRGWPPSFDAPRPLL
jgi:hypothetical protein